MADEKMQNENKKSLNTREDNVAEDIRREAAGKDAEMAADKTTEKEGAPKKKNLAFVVRPQNSKNSSRLQGKRPGQGRQGQNQGRPNGDGKRPAAGQSRSNGEGKPARTDVTVLARHTVSQPALTDIHANTQEVLTHVQCVLHTGRTHQIRVHLSHVGFPLAGDDLYGGHLDYIHRQALHAGYLAFTHPMTQEYIELRAPIPTDMKELLHL